jgi:hypothetical protein
MYRPVHCLHNFWHIITLICTISSACVILYFWVSLSYFVTRNSITNELYPFNIQHTATHIITRRQTHISILLKWVIPLIYSSRAAICHMTQRNWLTKFAVLCATLSYTCFHKLCDLRKFKKFGIYVSFICSEMFVSEVWEHQVSSISYSVNIKIWKFLWISKLENATKFKDWKYLTGVNAELCDEATNLRVF